MAAIYGLARGKAHAAVRRVHGRRDLALRECRRAARDPLVRPGHDRKRGAHGPLGVLQLPADRPLRVLRRRRRGPARLSERPAWSRISRALPPSPRSRSWISTVGIELWQLFALVFLGALLDAPGATARAALLPGRRRARPGCRMERASGIRVEHPAGVDARGCSDRRRARRSVRSHDSPLARRRELHRLGRSRRRLRASTARRAERPSEPRGRFFEELADGMRFIWNQRLAARTRRSQCSSPICSRRRFRSSSQSSRVRSTTAPPISGSCIGALGAGRSRRRARLQRNRPPAPATTHVRNLLRARAGAATSRSRRFRHFRSRSSCSWLPGSRLDRSIRSSSPCSDRDGPERPPRPRLRRGAGRRVGFDSARRASRRSHRRDDRGRCHVSRDRRAPSRSSSRYGFFNPAFRAMDRAAET